MTVRELIGKLSALPNQDAEVIVNVKTETKIYGQAQVSPYEVDQSYTGACVRITLPKGMYIGSRKVPLTEN